MSSNWDYAQLARAASEHGGPQKYLDELKAGSKLEGRAQGLFVGVAIGGAVAVKGYDYLKKRKELAAVAERKLLEGMQATTEAADPAPDDDEVV
jgi:hypothetical protein